MNRVVIGAALGLLLATAPVAQAESPGIRHLDSSDAFARVDQRLRAAIEEKGLTLMSVIDHADNARRVDLSLPPTRTFVFGNPAVGTPTMQCQGSMALDLPKVHKQLEDIICIPAEEAIPASAKNGIGIEQPESVPETVEEPTPSPVIETHLLDMDMLESYVDIVGAKPVYDSIKMLDRKSVV